MRSSGWIAVTWVVGMMISPEALRLNGWHVGTMGGWYILSMGLALAAYGLSTRIHAHGYRDEQTILSRAYGDYWAAVLLLMARPALVVVLATATLVTAGFVFNETFVFWFPNFAFAFLLLGLVLAVNLAGPRTAVIVQAICVAIAFAGLVLLGIFGLFAPKSASLAAPAVSLGPTVGDAAGAMLLFLGYELIGYVHRGTGRVETIRFMRIGLLCSAILLLVWNWVGLRLVPAERLTDTYIPHILVAKAAAGGWGRPIIGMVGIAGTVAAVNLIFRAVSDMLGAMAERRQMPAFFNAGTARPAALVLLAVVTAVLMAVGFAGSEHLDIALRAAMLLYLVFYGLVQLAVAIIGRRNGTGSHLPLLLSVLLLVAAGFALFEHTPQSRVMQWMAVFFIFACIAANIGRWLAANSRMAGRERLET